MVEAPVNIDPNYDSLSENSIFNYYFSFKDVCYLIFCIKDVLVKQIYYYEYILENFNESVYYATQAVYFSIDYNNKTIGVGMPA